MAIKAIERLRRLNYLILIKGTGTPSELARKLGVSRRCAFDHINALKDVGAPIKYCKTRNSYYYEEVGECYFTFLKDANLRK